MRIATAGSRIVATIAVVVIIAGGSIVASVVVVVASVVIASLIDVPPLIFGVVRLVGGSGEGLTRKDGNDDKQSSESSRKLHCVGCSEKRKEKGFTEVG